jgi:hypothetical protein
MVAITTEDPDASGEATASGSTMKARSPTARIPIRDPSVTSPSRATTTAGPTRAPIATAVSLEWPKLPSSCTRSGPSPAVTKPDKENAVADNTKAALSTFGSTGSDGA